ncbi:MAG: hypothetical protein IID41_14085 [Planctomycetes bacterium]|nr:hypothetical protein [Planctomycetota bacterium]
MRKALEEGCYSEILESARRPEYREDYQWFIRDFFAGFPDGGRIGRYMQKLFSRTLNIPSSWAFVRSDTGDVRHHDWLAVATGPRQQARQLATSVRESGLRLTHDVTNGSMGGMLEPTKTAVLAAMGLGDGWPRRRMEMDMHRTCQLAAAELVLDVRETERGNLRAIEGWSEGHVSLWFVGRRMAHGQTGAAAIGR